MVYIFEQANNLTPLKLRNHDKFNNRASQRDPKLYL